MERFDLIEIFEIFYNDQKSAKVPSEYLFNIAVGAIRVIFSDFYDSTKNRIDRKFRNGIIYCIEIPLLLYACLDKTDHELVVREISRDP